MLKHIDYIDLTKYEGAQGVPEPDLMSEPAFREFLNQVTLNQHWRHVAELFRNGVTLPNHPIKVSVALSGTEHLDVQVHSHLGARPSSYANLLACCEEGVFWRDFWRELTMGLEYIGNYSQTEDDFDFAEAYVEELPDDVKTVYKYMMKESIHFYLKPGKRDEYIRSLGKCKHFNVTATMRDDSGKKQVFHFRNTPDGLEMVHRNKAYRMHIRQNPISGMLILVADRMPETKLTRRQYATVCSHFINWLKAMSGEFNHIKHMDHETHYFALPPLDGKVADLLVGLWNMSLDKESSTFKEVAYYHGNFKLYLADDQDKPWTFRYSYTTGKGVELDLGRFSLVTIYDHTLDAGTVACMELPIEKQMLTNFYRMIYQLIDDLSSAETPIDKRNMPFFDHIRAICRGTYAIDWLSLAPSFFAVKDH